MPERFATIVADPPWLYDSDGSQLIVEATPLAGPGTVGKRYAGMSVDELCALPIRDKAEDHAHLYLWTTNQFIVEAHRIVKAWGFKQKTILTWTKTHHGDIGRVSMKTGYYFRGATEHCLFAVRGSLRLRTMEGLPTGYLWPRLPHSVKPDAFYDLVEKASPGPYLELFARRARLGDWHYWGHQSLGTVEMAA